MLLEAFLIWNSAIYHLFNMGASERAKMMSKLMISGSKENAESNPQVQVWQKTQVSQGNSFSNILIPGNAPVRPRYET